MSTSSDRALPVSDAHSVKSPARRQFFALATAVGGAAFAGAIFHPASADIVTQLGKVFNLDATVLNFAFSIEELEADFFNRVARSSGYNKLGAPERSVFSLIGAQDEIHRQMLEDLRPEFEARNAGVYQSPNASDSLRPRIFIYPRLNNADEIMRAALDIKETALFTYHGAASLLNSKKLLSQAVAIAGVEGRHASVLRQMMGLDPVPAPFEGAIGAKAADAHFTRYNLKGGAAQQ